MENKVICIKTSDDIVKKRQVIISKIVQARLEKELSQTQLAKLTSMHRLNLSIILDTFNSNKFKLRHSIFDSIACASQPVANHHLKNKFCGYSSSSWSNAKSLTLILPWNNVPAFCSCCRTSLPSFLPTCFRTWRCHDICRRRCSCSEQCCILWQLRGISHLYIDFRGRNG